MMQYYDMQSIIPEAALLVNSVTSSMYHVWNQHQFHLGEYRMAR